MNIPNKAFLCCVTLIVTVVLIPPALSMAQRRAARVMPQTVARDYTRLYGVYEVSGAAPGGMDDLNININPATTTARGVPRGIRCSLDFTERLKRPVRSGGINTDTATREYAASEMEITAMRMSFTTEEKNGVSFRFEGRFTGERPNRRDPNPVALEGRLTKLERGREVATDDLKFTMLRE